MPQDNQRRRLYEQCVEQHAASLFRVAFRLTGSADAAEELVQETYLCAWKDLAKLNDESKLRGWMFEILRHQSSKVSQRRMRERELTDAMITQHAERAATAHSDLQDDVQAAFDRLDQENKLPLLLVSLEGFSIDTAAEILGVPRGTVLSRLHRGRQKLKEILARAGWGAAQQKSETSPLPSATQDHDVARSNRDNE